MKIAMYPYKSDSNKYIELIQKSIHLLDIEINSFDVVFKDRKLLNETEYFIFNWYESLYTTSLIKQTVRLIKKYLKLLILVFKGKKIIWVLHNKIPHDSKNTFYPTLLMKYLSKKSYKIIIHSHESKDVIRQLNNSDKVAEKIVYIPHPNYINAYEDGEELKKFDDDKLNLLFIGAIKPYKNVDLIIKAVNELSLPNIRLILAGKIENKEYEEYINSLINNNNNIITDFRFIRDNEIQGIIKSADILILPYDIKSSLNSGTILLAFSNKRTVLSPSIGTLKDFKNQEDFFAYDYEDEEEHKQKLKENIANISKMFSADSSIFKRKGERCFSVVEDKNSLERISYAFKKILNIESNVK